MNATRVLLSCGLVIGLAAVSSVPSGSVRATAPDAVPSSTRADQVDLALTVYNGMLALVRDVRDLSLPSGHSDLRFVDVASTINPSTVHIRSLTDPARLSVVEQNYEFDLLEPDKLLRKYIGREVTLVRARQENGTTRHEDVAATLVSYNNGPIWRIGNEYVTGLAGYHVRFPELPDNLYSRPTLVWTLNNRAAAKHRVEASYLAGGLTWRADYVLTVARDDRAADLNGWVTLTNTSGTSFPRARLQLVAGDLNRVHPAAPAEKELSQQRMMAVAEAADMRQESFSEYHLYTLGRKTTINDQQTKQVALLDGAGVPVAKRFVVHGQRHFYRSGLPGLAVKDQVQVFYRFRNAEASGLGLPMPAGTIRVYQSDANGGVQFVGEDRIDHTPKDEMLDLKIGNAFDVVSERKQTDFEKIGTSTYEMAFEVTLRNHKTTPVTVEVHEPFGGTWRILKSSHQGTKTDAWSSQFDVPVSAGGTAVLTYRVRVEF